MRLAIKTKNLTFTPAISEYIEMRIGALEKFLASFERETEVRIDIEIARTTKHHRKGDVFYAEANLHLPNKEVRAEEFSADIRSAIDALKNTLHEEVMRYKEKYRSVRRARKL